MRIFLCSLATIGSHGHPYLEEGWIKERENNIIMNSLHQLCPEDILCEPCIQFPSGHTFNPTYSKYYHFNMWLI